MVKGFTNEIPQWVEHHISIGVTTMIIFDDNGDDSPLPTILRDRIETGDVELLPAPQFNVSTKNSKVCL